MRLGGCRSWSVFSLDAVSTFAGLVVCRPLPSSRWVFVTAEYDVCRWMTKTVLKDLLTDVLNARAYTDFLSFDKAIPIWFRLAFQKKKNHGFVNVFFWLTVFSLCVWDIREGHTRIPPAFFPTLVYCISTTRTILSMILFINFHCYDLHLLQVYGLYYFLLSIIFCPCWRPFRILILAQEFVPEFVFWNTETIINMALFVKI